MIYELTYNTILGELTAVVKAESVIDAMHKARFQIQRLSTSYKLVKTILVRNVK